MLNKRVEVDISKKTNDIYTDSLRDFFFFKNSIITNKDEQILDSISKIVKPVVDELVSYTKNFGNMQYILIWENHSNSFDQLFFFDIINRQDPNDIVIWLEIPDRYQKLINNFMLWENEVLDIWIYSTWIWDLIKKIKETNKKFQIVCIDDNGLTKENYSRDQEMLWNIKKIKWSKQWFLLVGQYHACKLKTDMGDDELKDNIIKIDNKPLWYLLQQSWNNTYSIILQWTRDVDPNSDSYNSEWYDYIINKWVTPDFD